MEYGIGTEGIGERVGQRGLTGGFIEDANMTNYRKRGKDGAIGKCNDILKSWMVLVPDGHLGSR
jgi:hypothetical protein